MFVKRIAIAGSIAALVLALIPPAANADSATDLGGWDEVSGPFTQASVSNLDGVSTPVAASAPNHRGKSETSDATGTTRKRALGWTTWVGKYHYTRARMESDAWFGSNKGKVWTDSGRRWGKNGTHAVSGWSSFNPDRAGTPGRARTYYGS